MESQTKAVVIDRETMLDLSVFYEVRSMAHTDMSVMDVAGAVRTRRLPAYLLGRVDACVLRMEAGDTEERICQEGQKASR